MTNNDSVFPITEELNGATLAAALRQYFPERSWKEIRTLIGSRHVKLGDSLCLDPARRVQQGEQVEVLSRPDSPLPESDSLVIRHLDKHIVVVEKPAMLNTVRHPSERDWSERKRSLSPTLDELVAKKIQRISKSVKPALARLRVVQRLDKQTSGLVVFARTVEAERGLGKQFHEHTVHRRYLAIISGYLPSQRIESYLIRDRGDGRRGSSPNNKFGKLAITHVQVARQFANHTLVACRLETGRTHQIRIHLAELGHPVCGDPVYNRKINGEVIWPDESGAPRLALHAQQLGFVHPVTLAEMHWEMPLPLDLQEVLSRLSLEKNQLTGKQERASRKTNKRKRRRRES